MVEEVDGEGQEGKGGSRKGEASQRECAMDMTVNDSVCSELEPNEVCGVITV